MVVASKFVAEQFSRCSCNELMHPHSCWLSLLQNLWRFTWSNGKYYLPIALIHFLKRAPRGDVRMDLVLWNTLVYYAQMILGGVVNGSLIVSSMCTLRHLLGEFRWYTMFLVPSLLGGASIAFMSHRVRHLQHTAIFQSLIETLLLQRGNWLTRSLASSLTLQTLVFMVCSVIILLGKLLRWHNGFWFLTPDTPPDKAVTPWSIYIMQGMRKYLLIGLALDVFKAIVSCVKSSRWQWRQLRLESMALLGCYVGIYRTSLCVLRIRKEMSEISQQFVASFVGGLSYLCYPKLTILSYALLEAGRTIWGRHLKMKSRSKKRFGCADLIYPLALGYLIHLYVLQPQRVSNLAGIIIDNATANYARNITKRLQTLQQI